MAKIRIEATLKEEAEAEATGQVDQWTVSFKVKVPLDPSTDDKPITFRYRGSSDGLYELLGKLKKEKVVELLAELNPAGAPRTLVATLVRIDRVAHVIGADNGAPVVLLA